MQRLHSADRINQMLEHVHRSDQVECRFGQARLPKIEEMPGVRARGSDTRKTTTSCCWDRPASREAVVSEERAPDPTPEPKSR